MGLIQSGKLGTLIVEHRNFDCKAIEVAFPVCVVNSSVVAIASTQSNEPGKAST